MSQIHGTGDHRPTTQGLNQQAPGSLKGANKSHKVTIFSGSGASRKGNFFTKLASKVSAFVRSIFSATAALDRKIERTENKEIRELTAKHSKILAEIKAPIKAEIKKLEEEVTQKKNILYAEKNTLQLSDTYDSSPVDNAQKELADASSRLENARSRLKKIK